METAVIVAGFGGQGVLFAGQLLAHAALYENKHVTWIPSYGPEMRGGTAHCTVVISDRPVGSPLVRNPDVVVAMNRPSLEKYEPLVAAGGLLLANVSLVDATPARTDIRLAAIPANQIARNAGSEKAANMAMVGALLALRPLLCQESVALALQEHLPPQHRDLLAANLRALRGGYAAALHPETA